MDIAGGLRVLIVADDPLTRAGLNALLSAQAGCDMVGESGVDLRDGAVPLSAAPDVILADLGPDTGAFGDRLVALEAFGVPVLAVLANRTLGAAALAAGAGGYVQRAAGGERIAAALTAVAAGLQVSEPAVRAHGEPVGPQPEPPLEDLTPREVQVLQLLAEGLPNKAIARSLRISEHTVKFHVTAVMGKLGAHSRTEAVTRAARAGLLIL
ncbi:MAG TPA: response regulator transcription factor [bacterium]|jgi:DNA-binding NarL/FixJ family response regulator